MTTYSNKPASVGLSDPRLVRQTEAALAQSALIARGKPTVTSAGELILPNTTLSVGANSVSTTTSANNSSADTVTVYSSQGAIYASAIDQTLNQTIVNQVGVSSIVAGNNITITSTGISEGTGIVTVSAVLDGNNAPGGTNTQVQFNDGSVFGGNSGFTFNKTTGVLTAPFFSGPGNSLSNIQGTNVTGAVAFAGTANSVALANVSGAGNIASINLTGSSSNILYGNGVFAAVTTSAGIANGTSNVTVPTVNGNVNLVSAGNTTMVVTGTGANIAGTLSASGNANVGNLGTAGLITATGNVTAGNLVTGGALSVTGNATVGNISATNLGNISSINLTGSSSNILYGNGVFAAVATSAGIANGTSNVTVPTVNGNVNIVSSGNTTMVVTGTGANITGTANVSGNANVGNLGTALITATGNITGANLVTGGLISATGNITGGNVSATNLSGNGGNITYQQTTIYYVDPLRTANYTATGTIIQPFANVTAAISAAVTAGITDANPAEIILLNSITENITLKPGIFLTSLGTGTHGSPIITGTVTVTSSTGSTSSNHYSISNLRIVAPTNGHCINFTGTAPQKLFMRDMWMDANGTGDCIYMDNSGSGSTVQMDIAHLTHSGSGDIYCINITAGSCYVTDIETSGATQVAAVQTGAVMTIDSSELDAVGDVVCETYGTGTLTITNSIITNTQANGNGIKINSAGSTVTIGQCLFSIPTGTGSAVYYNPAATLYGSTIAFASISFIPNTNTTVDARLLPVPLTTVPGTIANPIFAGNITSTTTGTWTLTDNSSSSLSFDTAGKAGVLKLVTTNSAEGVTMSGTLSVTGNANVGNLGTALITATGNITGANLVTGGVLSVTGNANVGNIGATLHVGNLSGTGNSNVGNLGATGVFATTLSATGNANVGNIGTTTLIATTGNITTINSGLLQNGNSNITITANGNISLSATGAPDEVVITSTGVNVTGTLSASGNITGANISTAGNISGNTNGFAIGYLNIPQVAAANATLALTDAGKHYYSTSAGNFTLTVPNNTSVSFATGTAISIVVQSAGNVLVNAASGVTLYLAGNSTAANRVVSNYGMATLMKVATDTWMINGTGVA
jgi:hypothetical protein